MNFELTQLPERAAKPRLQGVNMIMDKGLSTREAEDLASVAAQHIDFIKLGFGTAVVSPNIEEKIKIYQNAGIHVFMGGTLFEAFLIRDQLETYLDICRRLGLQHIEISDGSMQMDHSLKCKIISGLSDEFTLLSEVGSKDANYIMTPHQWIELMQSELDAGAAYVIAEAREAGTVGICKGSGEVRQGLVDTILSYVPDEKIIWEAPQKEQQKFFIELLGCDCNLGNIAPSEVIALEAMRIGLRGDTFHTFLQNIKSSVHIQHG